MSSQQKLCMDGALLEQPFNQPARENPDGRWPLLLTVLCFTFLAFNSVMAVYRSNGDLVGFSYLDLVLLFYCLRQYFYWLRQFKKTALGSPRREHLKKALWLLTTMLTAAFSYKVAAVLPFPMQVMVWAMAGATVLGGFYAFFLHREGKA